MTLKAWKNIFSNPTAYCSQADKDVLQTQDYTAVSGSESKFTCADLCNILLTALYRIYTPEQENR